MADAPQANLYVVSAPSGAGKTSLVKALLEREANIRLSVSYTTRKQRSTETDGEDYFFVEKEEFERLERAGEMLESADVFGNRYGTGRRQVEEKLAAGHPVVLEIDWQGARQVREKEPGCRSIFILPPSRTELERRLRGRATDSDEVIARRLSESLGDMGHWSEFDYVVINDDFAEAVEELAAIVSGQGEAHRATTPGAAARAEAVLAS